MRVLIACEFSGIVRDAFIARGHDAWSVDILPTERPGPHVRADVMAISWLGWDLMIAHPPCTYLARCGARWWSRPGVGTLQADAIRFVVQLLSMPVPRIALENPPGRIGTVVRPADQYVQPWQFGDGEVKQTGLWLKNLPKLVPTNEVDGRAPRVHMMPGGKNQGKNRSRTPEGLARAMAEQWG